MTQTPVEDRLLAAMASHVPFDGWSEPAFRAAIAQSEVNETVARALYPRDVLVVVWVHTQHPKTKC